MEQKELSRVPVVVEATWNQEKDTELRRSFVNSRLANLALMEHDELNFDEELSMVA